MHEVTATRRRGGDAEVSAAGVPVLLTSRESVAYLELNRPDKRNAFDGPMIRTIIDGVNNFASDPEIAVLVLRGAGPYFCAGGDIRWMRQSSEASREKRLATAQLVNDLFQTVADCPLVTFAVVRGGAFGGGVGLAAACDVVTAARTAVFATTETSLGIVPACITNHVVGRVGVTVTRRMFLSCERMSAAAALAAGLVDFVVPDDQLEESACEHIARLAEGDGTARKTVKALLARFRPGGPDADRAHVSALAESWESPEAKAGMDRFLSRRDK